MKTIAAQYLEYAPAGATPAKIRKRLRQAFETLPMDTIILGWDLPVRLEEAVAEETARHNANLYRWHPLLASDTGFALPKEWQTINLRGEPVAGFRGLPEFTFICPNRSDVQEWVAERVEVAAQRGIYRGIFFDRMRFPSPAENPQASLACFCKYCQRTAADAGLDLEAVRRKIESLLADGGAGAFVETLFKPADDPLLEAFFAFRSNTVTHLVGYAAKLARSHGLGVGLDCFSPALTRMVGQDLVALNTTCDWVKLMIYPRVFGPAGLPFELNALTNWLVTQGTSQAEAIRVVAEASGLPLTAGGLDSTETIAREVQRGQKAAVTNLLAGVALVQLEKIHTPSLEDIRADLTAYRSAGADGLVLSWDLWHIQQEYFKEVAQIIA